jgi:hypothetical protein
VNESRPRERSAFFDRAIDAASSVDALMFSVGMFAVALALRLYAAARLAGEPVWDGHYYDFGARRIASGFGYADEIMRDGHPVWHPWCHYPVGYSAYLGAFYKHSTSSSERSGRSRTSRTASSAPCSRS